MIDERVVLITGASGFIGRYVVDCFLEDGWTVVALGDEDVPPRDGTRLFRYRIRLPSLQLGAILAAHPPNLSIHCAGASAVGPSLIDPAADFHAGPVVTFELLEALRRHASQSALVFLSSAAVYGNPQSLPIRESQEVRPISPYGFHKAQCEQLCREYSTVFGLRTASVRIFSAYGAGLRKQVLWDTCRKALRDKTIVLNGTGKESRDFIHARDVARALLFVVNRGCMAGETYNLASGNETTIGELATLLTEALGVTGALIFNGVASPGVPLRWRADIGRIRALGFEPTTSLVSGIGEFATWCASELASDSPA